MKILRFEISNRENKKYVAKLQQSDGTIKKIHFGDSRYQHYKDRTPQRYWKHMDHGNPLRRINYRKRAGAQKFHLKKYSPAWFSWNYLW